MHPQVPIDEVLDVLTAILPQPPAATLPPDAASLPATPAPLPCPPGSFYVSGKCWVCPAGSYAFNPASWTCKPCFHGRCASAATLTPYLLLIGPPSHVLVWDGCDDALVLVNGCARQVHEERTQAGQPVECDAVLLLSRSTG